MVCQGLITMKSTYVSTISCLRRDLYFWKSAWARHFRRYLGGTRGGWQVHASQTPDSKISSGSKLQVSGSKKTRNLHPSCSHEVTADHDDSFLVAQTVKNPPAMWETWVRSLGQEDPWKRARQPTPVFLPGESPWTEEPGGLQSMGPQGVGHDWGTKHKHVMRRQTWTPASLSEGHDKGPLEEETERRHLKWSFG